MRGATQCSLNYFFDLREKKGRQGWLNQPWRLESISSCPTILSRPGSSSLFLPPHKRRWWWWFLAGSTTPWSLRFIKVFITHYQTMPLELWSLGCGPKKLSDLSSRHERLISTSRSLFLFKPTPLQPKNTTIWNWTLLSFWKVLIRLN